MHIIMYAAGPLTATTKKSRTQEAQPHSASRGNIVHYKYQQRSLQDEYWPEFVELTAGGPWNILL